MAGVPPASSEEAQASHPVVPASEDNASAVVSSSSQGFSTRHGKKWLASEPNKQNANTAVSGGKRTNSEQKNEDTAFGSRASAVKRESAASTSIATGAIPPARRRPRTSGEDESVEANKS